MWHPSTGSPLLLTDPGNGIKVLWNLTGFMSAPVRVATRRTPGRPGARLRSVVASERDLEVGLRIDGPTRQEFLRRARHVVRQIKSGPGRLEVIEGDGSHRWVECQYTEGLEGVEGPGSGDDTWWKPVVSFVAPQPYARTQPITVPWSLAPTGRGWFPIIPIQLTPSGIAGRKAVFNPGDVDTHSVITVRGPGEQLVVRHRGTGRAAHLDYRIPDSGAAVIPRQEGVVIIDTAEKTIVNGYGANLFTHLTDEDPSLFPLQPGMNPIEVQLVAASRNSSVSMTFDPLYESL